MFHGVNSHKFFLLENARRSGKLPRNCLFQGLPLSSQAAFDAMHIFATVRRRPCRNFLVEKFRYYIKLSAFLGTLSKSRRSVLQ
jgi:hypothetical protein